MKKQFSFMICFFMIGLFVGGLFILPYYFVEKKNILKKVSNDLINISEKKAEKINDYLFEMEEDIRILQESDEVKSLLQLDLSSENFVAQKNIELKTKMMVKQIEAYLITHPNLTLKELQNNSEFEDIAVQKIAKTGYSWVIDYDTLIVVFHMNQKIVGTDLSVLSDKLPEFWSIYSRAKGGKKVSGFYTWIEPDGELTQKYLQFIPLKVKTADNIRLSVAATIYINEYKTVGNISAEVDEFLNDFKKNKNYNDLVLISLEGYVSYITNAKKNLGINLKWKTNLERGLSKNYLNVEEKQNLSFYGPYIGEYGDVYPKFSIMAPVYDGEYLLGYIGLIREMDKIFEITKEIIPPGEIEETYLINKNLLLISPLRHRDFDMFVQSIDTENIRNCFSMKNLEYKGHEIVEEFLNYEGHLVLGTHFSFFEINWCLLTEVDKDEGVDKVLKEKIKRHLFILFVGILIFSLIGFFVGIYFDKKKRKLRKIRRNF